MGGFSYEGFLEDDGTGGECTFEFIFTHVNGRRWGNYVGGEIIDHCNQELVSGWVVSGGELKYANARYVVRTSTAKIRSQIRGYNEDSTSSLPLL